MLPTSAKSAYYHAAAMGIDSCRSTLQHYLTPVGDRIGDLFKMIPKERRAGNTLLILNHAVATIPLGLAYYYNSISLLSCLCINAAIAGVTKRGENCYAKEIRQVIEHSHLELENEKKEGVALILNASPLRDFKGALRDDEQHLEDVKLIAKRFLIESKTVSSEEQLSKTIEDVCNKSDKPVKLVLIRGDGFLKEINLGLFSTVKSDDAKLVEALKKTDEAAHIILYCPSTGKLRSEEGISFADQLSHSLPGRMVTGLPKEVPATLIEHKDYQQGITLLGLNPEKLIEQPMRATISTHSYRYIDNQRTVTTLIPANHLDDLINLSGPITKKPLLMERIKECSPDIDMDNTYKENPLSSEYKYSHLDLANYLTLTRK